MSLPPSPSPADAEATAQDEPMFVLSGQVTMLHITEGSVNLLQGMQNKMALAGLGAAAQGMAGTVATSAMLAMYEGEQVNHFGCYVGDRLVIGSFPDVDFADGDEVKVVATRLDEKVDYAHALVRPKDGLLWIPYSINKGRWMIARWIFIACAAVTVFGLLMLAIFNLFSPAKGGYISIMFDFLPIFIILYGIMGGGVFWSSRHDGIYAESIFKVLGFKRPSVVNLSPYSLARQGTGGSYMVYELRKALRAYDSLSKAPPSGLQGKG